MRRRHEMFALLALAAFAMALAMGGLAVGVVRVPRAVELTLFALAGSVALAATCLLLAPLLRSANGRADWRIRRRERALRSWAAMLLLYALAAGLASALVRSEATVVPPASYPSTAGDGRGGLIAALAVAGILLALGAAVVGLVRMGRGGLATAVAAGGGALSMAGALALGIGHLDVEPQLVLAPTLRVDRPTLLGLHHGSEVTVRPQLTVRVARRRPPTLLSLGGLQISLRLGRGETLPPTR